MAALAAFLILYLALAGWFAWKAYSLIAGAFLGGKHGFYGIFFGLPAAFLAIFMLKALWFVRPGGKLDDLELTAAAQPQLFEFLNRLADEAGAPRPHRVFVSARVNAAVFYDLSILNFLFPSKKNLEVGLGLVNALSLSELKAVLAHEFGHFAQRSMAVGRWVYVAQQIAEHIVWRRDQLDRFLRGLSRSDIRVAWIGWLLRLVVWSIRSLLETLFQGVMLAQRALSREMEMQADLVAVALTGSDALIHALHQAQAADDAWERTLAFADTELHRGRKTVDLFAIQSRVVERMRDMLGDPDYGRAPARPAANPQAHRVFRAELAHPPRMWQTHPHNHEREENAKRVYLTAPDDQRSAWSVFADAQSLRREVSLRMVPNIETPEADIDESLRQLDAEYAIESLQPHYRGVYLGRSIVRSKADCTDLYDAAGGGTPAQLAALYPPTIADELAQWRNLGKEIHLLECVQRGEFTPVGGIVHHRNRELPREHLTQAIAELKGEAAAIEQRILGHDRRCRTEHRAAAQALGGGWDAYLQGLLAALHYAEHAQADLRDAQRFLAREYQVVTADGNVSKRELARLIKGCAVVHAPLVQIYQGAAEVDLDSALLARLKLAGWNAALEEFTLPRADEQNIGKWLDAIDSWINTAANALGHLARHALELLLETERRVAQARTSEQTLEPAPAPTRIRAAYARLLPGAERKLQQKLDWWDRFQTADGWLPAGARLAVAGSIVAGVVSLGGAVGNATVTLYNGLATPVRVSIGAETRTLQPDTSVAMDVPLAPVLIRATNPAGLEIEQFEAKVDIAFADYVYNIAGASPLIEWTAVYGGEREVPERRLGAPRWTSVDADVLFAQPPATISSKSGGGTRTVISGFGAHGPGTAQTLLDNPAELATIAEHHAHWDATGSAHLLEWLQAASTGEHFSAVLAARLQAQPDDVLLRRAAQDYAGAARDEVCARDRAEAIAQPGAPDLQYLAARCLDSEEAKDRAFMAAHEQAPSHPWLAYAAGYAYAQSLRWDEARAALETARTQLHPVADSAGLDLARIERLQSGSLDTNRERALQVSSPSLEYLIGQETDAGYQSLHAGRLAEVQNAAGDERGRLLRLAAASAGADAALVQKALSLPADEALDSGTLGAALGLALREHQDATDLQTRLIDAYGEESARRMQRFAESVLHTDTDTAEAELRGLSPLPRGQALVVGCILLGKRAPPAWKQAAERLLFKAERPYLG